MKEVNPWFLAIRPKTLPAGAGPVLLGLALSYEESRFDYLVAILTLLCTVLLQIASNLINDYYDGVGGLDDHDRLGPTRVVQAGLLPARSVKKAFQACLLLSFALGIYLMIVGGPFIITIGLLSIFFSWAYTGGPFPLSYFGLGEIFAFIFFGPIAVLGTYHLQTRTFSFPNEVWLMGCGVGLISSALMGVNNLRDRFGDKEKGKVTMSTLLPQNISRKLILLFLVISQFLAFMSLYQKTQFTQLLGLIPFGLFYQSWYGLLGSTEGRDLNNTLATVGKYLFLYSLTYSILHLLL